MIVDNFFYQTRTNCSKENYRFNLSYFDRKPKSGAEKVGDVGAFKGMLCLLHLYINCRHQSPVQRHGQRLRHSCGWFAKDMANVPLGVRTIYELICMSLL